MNDQTRNTKDSVQVCSILHVAHVGMRRVILVHDGLNEVEGVLVIYTLLRSHLFVNCCIKRYSLHTSPSVTVNCCQLVSRVLRK